MKVDRLALVKLRNGFYKDGFRRMTFVLLIEFNCELDFGYSVVNNT